jgi:hypothetical protein
LTDHEVLDPQVQEILDSQVPLRTDAESDWAGALARAEGVGAGKTLASPRKQGRRFLVPALAAAVLVIAGAATAAGVRMWSGPSSLSTIDTDEATSLVQYTLGSDFSTWKTGDRIALWRMPQPDGSVCVFMALASSAPTGPDSLGPNRASGGFCSLSGTMRAPGNPIGVSLNSSLQSNGYTWLIYGMVSSGSGIEKLGLRSAAGTVPLAYDNGWFLGQLARTSTASDKLAPGGPYFIVGSDSGGTTVAQVDLQERFPGLQHN